MGIPGSANPLLLASADAAPASYQVSRSLRFNAPDSAFLSRTPSSAGNRKTWTLSCWLKRCALSPQTGLFAAGTNSNNISVVYLDNVGKLWYYDLVSGAFSTRVEASAVFRDFSAWYHILVAVDTTQATAANRVRLYVNGSELTAFTTATYPAQNFDTQINTTTIHTINKESDFYANYGNHYIAECHFIDGQRLTPSSFTEVSATTGQLVPKAYTGSYGTNGFKLDFADNSAATAAALGKDTSGNGNNWTPNNLSINTGGPTSVAAASGALPIYNTTDTYGATKGTGTRTDANASSLVLAVPMDGANNGTTFTDESATIKGSGSAKTVTANGNAKTVTSQSKYYGSSAYLDGAGDSLTVPAGADFAYGTGDFTIEGWFYQTQSYAVTAGSLLWAQTTSGQNYFTIWAGITSQNLVFLFGSGGGTAITGPAYSLNSWNHFAVVRSGTTLSIYVNGIGTSGSCSFNFSDTTYVPTIGRYTHADAQNFQGHVQDFRVYKGVAKYTANFNPPSSTQNASVAAGNDSLVDTPVSSGTDTGNGGEVRGNYCTFNPLRQGSSVSLTNGNLDAATGATAFGLATGTIGVSGSGKYYWEITVNSSAGGSVVGIVDELFPVANFIGQSSSSVGYNANGYLMADGNTGVALAATYTSGDVIGVALNLDAGEVKFYKNNSLQHTRSSLAAKTWFPAISSGGGGNSTFTANFGARAFAYTAPSGFKCLADTSLPTPVVAKPSESFQTLLWTGDGASPRTITGLDFNPDLVWIKARANTGFWHVWFDALRGGEQLSSNQTDAGLAQGSNVSGYVSAYTSNGFTLTSGNTSIASVNGSTYSYVGWCWDAGSSNSTNNAGSITSTVRANASAGFSIVTYSQGPSNSTVGHGLGAAPHMIIAKSRTVAGGRWDVFHRSLGREGYMYLDGTNAAATYPNYWGSVLPTSTTFGVSLAGNFNNTGNMVAYCFAPVAGYSSFGSYVGTANADGPMVWLGFRPRWILFKNTSVGVEDWWLHDTARNTYNVMTSLLVPNSANAEGTNAAHSVDALSNGFKIRTTAQGVNGSGHTIVYAAFAEAPFQYARAR